jgi:hypothetical protein
MVGLSFYELVPALVVADVVDQGSALGAFPNCDAMGWVCVDEQVPNGFLTGYRHVFSPF